MLGAKGKRDYLSITELSFLPLLLSLFALRSLRVGPFSKKTKKNTQEKKNRIICLKQFNSPKLSDNLVDLTFEKGILQSSFSYLPILFQDIIPFASLLNKKLNLVAVADGLNIAMTTSNLLLSAT